MQIDKDASIAVVVKRDWVNLHGVKMFLRQPGNVQAEIRGVDESHILFATILDADDVRGVWIELAPNTPKPDSAAERFKLLVPWSQILTIVVAKEFPPRFVRKPGRSASLAKSRGNDRDRHGLASAVPVRSRNSTSMIEGAFV